MVLCVTSLRIRLWPPFGAVLGEEGGVKEPTLCTPRLPPTDVCSGSTSESADGAAVVLGGGRVEVCDVGGGGAIDLADTVAVISTSILLLCEHSVGGARAVALVFVCVVADNVVRRLV